MATWVLILLHQQNVAFVTRLNKPCVSVVQLLVLLTHRCWCYLVRMTSLLQLRHYIFFVGS